MTRDLLTEEVGQLLSEDHRQGRRYRLHAVTIPRMRWVGVLALSTLVLVHRGTLGPPLDLPAVVRIFACLLGYAAVLHVVLAAWFSAPSRRNNVQLGEAFVVLDLCMYAYVIAESGGDQSLLFFLPLVRVADQGIVSMRASIVVAVLAPLSFAAAVALQGSTGGPIEWGEATAKFVLLAFASGYIAFTNRFAYALRRSLKASLAQMRQFVSTLKAMNADLTRLANEAKAADKAKSEFLAAVSHELRTPLNGIIGCAQLLERTSTRSEQDAIEQVLHIRRSGEGLLLLIEDIIDYASLEGRGLSAAVAPFDPAKTVKEVVQPFARAAQSRGLAFDCRVLDTMPSRVDGDERRVRQILNSLLDNALKFTEHGRIALEATVEGVHGGSQLRLTVQDTGIGIAQSALQDIFKPFTQVEGGPSRRFQGTGLGLALGQRVAAALGGTIEVHSQLGVGSTFTFSYPVQVLSAPAASTADMPSRLRLLIAEDNVLNQRIAVRMLERLGYAPDVVDDGLAAVSAAAESPYDLVLMDLQMPNLDGLEATRRIRSNTHIVQPCIIAVTANVLPEEQLRCLDAGMDGFIGKPLRQERLKDALVAAQSDRRSRAPWHFGPPCGPQTDVTPEIAQSV